MQETEFNLLDEPWVRVLQPSGEIKEVSLPEALLHAHEYVGLAGEMPTQDAAMLRLMLAVLHTVFTRADETGEPAPISSAAGAKRRWQALWRAKRMPEKPILDYFAQWHERFWLFHPQRPFWQVPEASAGTAYGAAKLNGEMLESSNKLRLFAAYSGSGKQELTYAQAARWLLHVNAYDDNSGKPKRGRGTEKEKFLSPGAGWVGRLGFINAQGDNLYETLLLNLVLLRDGQKLWGGSELPCWELDKPRSGQRTEIAVPDNAAQLLTLQSRRLLLCREHGKVTGYRLLGGDFFSKEDAFAEQMTLWVQVPSQNKNASPRMQPRRHDPSKQIWREFPAVMANPIEGKQTRKPGVIEWLAVLRSEKRYDRTLTCYRITGAGYGDSDYFINDAFSDMLTFHADLLTDLGRAWQQWIADEVERCERAAGKVGDLASNLEKAAGRTNKNDSARIEEAAKAAEAQYYFELDMPFRAWLASIDPQTDSEDARGRWHEQARKIALNLGEQMMLQAGPAAFSGRTVKGKADKKGDAKTWHYSAPEAYSWFRNGIYKIYKEHEGGQDGR